MTTNFIFKLIRYRVVSYGTCLPSEIELKKGREEKKDNDDCNKFIGCLNKVASNVRHLMLQEVFLISLLWPKMNKMYVCVFVGG